MQRRRICYQPRFGLGWIQLRHSGLAATITGNRSRRRTQATTTWQQQTEGQPINIENVHQNYVCNMFKCDFNLRTTIHHRKIRYFFNWMSEYNLATHVLCAATYTPVNNSLNHLFLRSHILTTSIDRRLVNFDQIHIRKNLWFSNTRNLVVQNAQVQFGIWISCVY